MHAYLYQTEGELGRELSLCGRPVLDYSGGSEMITLNFPTQLPSEDEIAQIARCQLQSNVFPWQIMLCCNASIYGVCWEEL